MSIGEFFGMGGYGFYVWGSYVACAVAIAAEVVAVRSRIATARRVTGDRESSQ
ncbi:MAG TPA: heme exporter protein CcmD [Casimicrobiaceae bacterium]